MNGFGNGDCSFTNTGRSAGSVCGVIEVSSILGGKIRSNSFCSGNVQSRSTAKVEFSIPSVDSHCSGELPWNSMCSFDFVASD